MKEQKPYAELVSQAQDAVASIKDAELRRVAFERVLDDLLSTGTRTPSQSIAAEKQKKRSQKQTSGEAKRSSGPKGRVGELVGDGFFKKPKTIAEVKAELGNRGHHIALTSLSGPLQKLCQEKVLRRQKSGAKGKKGMFSYSEW